MRAVSTSSRVRAQRSEDSKLKQAEAAIEKLEFAINHREHDPEYSDSLQRNMLIWNQWPSDAQAGASGREG
jgi:hypothetical protein